MSSPGEPKVQLANAYLLLPHIQSIQASHTLVQYIFQGRWNLYLLNHKRFFDLRLLVCKEHQQKIQVPVTGGDRLRDTVFLWSAAFITQSLAFKLFTLVLLRAPVVGCHLNCAGRAIYEALLWLNWRIVLSLTKKLNFYTIKLRRAQSCIGLFCFLLLARSPCGFTAGLHEQPQWKSMVCYIMRVGAESQAAASPPTPSVLEDTSFAYLILARSSGEHSKLNLWGINIWVERSFNDFCHLVAVAGIFSLPVHIDPFKWITNLKNWSVRFPVVLYTDTVFPKTYLEYLSM